MKKVYKPVTASDASKLYVQLFSCSCELKDDIKEGLQAAQEVYNRMTNTVRQDGVNPQALMALKALISRLKLLNMQREDFHRRIGQFSLTFSVTDEKASK